MVLGSQCLIKKKKIKELKKPTKIAKRDTFYSEVKCEYRPRYTAQEFLMIAQDFL